MSSKRDAVREFSPPPKTPRAEIGESDIEGVEEMSSSSSSSDQDSSNDEDHHDLIVTTVVDQVVTMVKSLLSERKQKKKLELKKRAAPKRKKSTDEDSRSTVRKRRKRNGKAVEATGESSLGLVRKETCANEGGKLIIENRGVKTELAGVASGTPSCSAREADCCDNAGKEVMEHNESVKGEGLWEADDDALNKTIESVVKAQEANEVVNELREDNDSDEEIIYSRKHNPVATGVSTMGSDGKRITKFMSTSSSEEDSICFPLEKEKSSNEKSGAGNRKLTSIVSSEDEEDMMSEAAHYELLKTEQDKRLLRKNNKLKGELDKKSQQKLEGNETGDQDENAKRVHQLYMAEKKMNEQLQKEIAAAKKREKAAQAKESSPPWYECRICKEVIVDPVNLACDHMFCLECLKDQKDKEAYVKCSGKCRGRMLVSHWKVVQGKKCNTCPNGTLSTSKNCIYCKWCKKPHSYPHLCDHPFAVHSQFKKALREKAKRMEKAKLGLEKQQ